MKKGLRHGYRKVSALAMTLDTGTSEPGDAAVPSLLGYHIDMNLNACLSFMMSFVTTFT